MRRLLLVTLAGALVVGLTHVADAAITQIKDSTDFDWQYEMDISPELEDLDSDSNPDFTKSGSGSSVSGGVLTYNTMPSGNLGFNGIASTTIWPGKYTLASGFTIETRLKAIQQSGGRAWGVFAGPAGTSANAYLNVGVGAQGWNSNNNLGTNNNSSEFHVFRVSQEPGAATYSVWRDGILLSDSLGSAYTVNRDGMWFGDGSGSYAGEVEMDYFRFTDGAFAPGAVVGDGDFASIESRPDAVQVKFDEYVSNPQPAGSPVNNDVVASFTGTFDGFLNPNAANTTASPLPDAAGVLVETSAGVVTFHDATSSQVTSDILGGTGGDTVTFTFVDPEGSGLPALVSAVAFRFGSTAADNITAEFFDAHGNLLDLATEGTGIVPGAVGTTDGYISYVAGVETPLIHQVVLSGASTDFWLIGSFYQSTALNDMVFSGLTVVPEPSTSLLLGLGLLGMAGFARRKRK